VGWLVRIIGVEKAIELIGQVGSVKGFVIERQRYFFWIGHAVQMAGGQFFGHRVLLDGLDFGDVKLLNHVKPRSDYHHLA
jgi:hypothetical protein